MLPTGGGVQVLWHQTISPAVPPKKVLLGKGRGVEVLSQLRRRGERDSREQHRSTLASGEEAQVVEVQCRAPLRGWDEVSDCPPEGAKEVSCP